MPGESSILEWARHGQSTANMTQTLSHRLFDPDLTDLGVEQAHALGRSLSSRDAAAPGFLVTSPLRRARRTAQIVAEHLHVPVAFELDGIRELNVGALDGRSDSAAWVAYHDVLNRWQAGDLDARFPGGEDGHELCRRVESALVHVVQSSGPVASSLVVAHGANLRAALPRLTGGRDPGSDLPNGDMARLGVTQRGPAGMAFTLETWGASPIDAADRG